jgi:polyhydroxyalkanoate synthase subunit PhaC
MTARTDGPAPLRRRGPRPLLLHLTLAMVRSNISHATSPSLNPDWPSSSATFTAAAAAIAAALRGQPSDGGGADGGFPHAAFPPAVTAQSLRQDAELIAGIAAYRRHPYARRLAEPNAIWSEGGSMLLDYGGSGPAALFVPSLVNRAYVLDLMADSSMLRWLSAQGVRPLLLDWGWPGEVERRFTLTDFVAGRLERTIDAAAAATGGKLALIGYCMGGTLAVAAALRRDATLTGLGLLAAPWDFHGDDPARAALLAHALPLFEPALAFNNTLPVDLLQVLFALLDPWGVADKYRAFARLDPTGPRARLFVALEDWLNDGVPLAAPVARECLAGWYGDNAPARGTWRIAGAVVEPQAVRLPTFVAAPARDRIVPPESARPLAQLIPDAVLHEPAAGHIGMAAGPSAERVLWRPLRDWLLKLDRR